MKNFVVLIACAFLATALAAPSVDEDKVKESIRRVKQAHDDCNADPATHVDFETLRKTHGIGKDIPNFGAHNFCVSKKLGWQNADGSVNEAEIRARVETVVGQGSKLDEIISKCSQSQGSSETTATHVLDCFFQNAPRPNRTHPRPQDHK